MTFRTESHGRYQIKSGPLAGAWAANAIRHKALVAKASGATREEAISSLKSKLDQLEAAALSDCDAEGAPSASLYEKAFGHLLPNMSDSYVAMLRAHLTAPDHLISATRLAEAAGYSGYEGANLHYGKLAQRVANEIGFTPPRRADGTEIWTSAIARDPALGNEPLNASGPAPNSETFDIQHFEWQLRPQVIEALRKLGL